MKATSRRRHHTIGNRWLRNESGSPWRAFEHPPADNDEHGIPEMESQNLAGNQEHLRNIAINGDNSTRSGAMARFQDHTNNNKKMPIIPGVSACNPHLLLHNGSMVKAKDKATNHAISAKRKTN